MTLGDLVNLLWSAQEIGKGSEYFYQKLEDEIMGRIRQIKDEEFQTLIECMADDKSKFSERFMEMMLKVIREKKDMFSLKSLVHVIWSFSKIDFSNT